MKCLDLPLSHDIHMLRQTSIKNMHMDWHCTSLVLYMKAKTTNMEIRFLFLFAVFTQWQCTHSRTASVSGDVYGWYYHRKFPVPPAKWAIIEVDVHKGGSLWPIIGIFTTKHSVDIGRQCIHTRYGQLGNKLLFPTLVPYRGYSRSLTCDSSYRHCTGIIRIQDYTPRSFSFSFGLPCYLFDQIRFSGDIPFQGLHYTMTIHVKNKITCHKLPVEDVCHSYMQFGAYPNLVGEGQMHNYLEPLPSCLLELQLEAEFLCYLFTHKCDPESNQIIPPCKEMCYEYIFLCESRLKYLKLWKHWKHIDCSYLPSKNKEIPCFYEPIACWGTPPRVKHGILLTDFRNIGSHYLPATVEYHCHEGFKMKGNKTIACTSDGHWSTPPQCLPKPTTTTHQTETKQNKGLCLKMN